MIDRRGKREMGAKVWQDGLPARPLRGTGHPVRWLAAGLILTGLIALHPMVIGLPALW